LQAGIDGSRLPDDQFHPFDLGGFEAFLGKRYGVLADRQAGDLIGSARPGCGLASKTGLIGQGIDSGALH